MPANFWLSSEAIPLTLDAVATLSDEQARLFLAELRWGSREQQTCPECGVVDQHYNIRTRKQRRCKHCFRTFSVTTGTPFADHKISYATEMAWREDVRRRDTADQLQALVRTVFAAGLSADWINYCRGNKRKVEILFQAPAVVPA